MNNKARKGIIVLVVSFFVIPIAIPALHLSGMFPAILQSTALLDGKLRATSHYIREITGIDTSGYWRFLCENSKHCEWIGQKPMIEYILYPEGIVSDPNGLKVLN